MVEMSGALALAVLITIYNEDRRDIWSTKVQSAEYWHNIAKQTLLTLKVAGSQGQDCTCGLWESD